MNKQQLFNIKTKARHYAAPVICVGLGVGSLIVAGVCVKNANQRLASLTEPDRLAGSNMIVLDNVDGTNLWRDMDEPDNLYMLEPA